MTRLPCCGGVGLKEKLDVSPKKGEATICLNCGSWHIYTTKDGATRKFAGPDLKRFDPEQLRMMRHVTRLIRKRGRMK